MRESLLTVSMLSFGLAALGSAQSPSPSVANDHVYTRAQLRQLLRDAHTPEQYNVLAAYYTSRQNNYLQQAAEEKQEWIRRSQNVYGPNAKYPRPVDSARNLYEYYDYEASEAGRQAEKYRRLSTPEPVADAPGAVSLSNGHA